MPSAELLSIAEDVINSIDPELSTESLRRLQAVFPEDLILGALDLLDRQCVFKLGLPLGRVRYEVLGSTDTYSVFMRLPAPVAFYCTCPAFAHAVLFVETYLMCKHILAARIADKISAAIPRPMTPQSLTAIIARQYRTSSE